MVAVPSPLSVKLAQVGRPVAVRAGVVRSGSVAVTVRVKGSCFGDGLIGDRDPLTGGRLVLVTVRVKVSVVGEGAVVGGDGDEWSLRRRCSRGCR